MNSVTYLEYRASSRLSKHEGESSLGLCDRLDRTRANSQRQLPTNHDYAVPTREYQTDQSSLITAQTAARSVLAQRRRQPQNPTIRSVDTVTPYQANALIEIFRSIYDFGKWPSNRLLSDKATIQTCEWFVRAFAMFLVTEPYFCLPPASRTFPVLSNVKESTDIQRLRRL
jgi:hypothetical protein